MLNVPLSAPECPLVRALHCGAGAKAGGGQQEGGGGLGGRAPVSSTIRLLPGVGDIDIPRAVQGDTERARQTARCRTRTLPKEVKVPAKFAGLKLSIRLLP